MHLLKKAWVNKWKNAKPGHDKPKEININPNWDKVLKATIFLASFSERAKQPATKQVIKPSNKAITITILPIQGKYLITKNTPAVTRVLLWTKEETGVGALIAKGNHLLNGYWALLVKAAKTKRKNKPKENMGVSPPEDPQNWAKSSNRLTSPARFVITVTIAPLIDLLLL